MKLQYVILLEILRIMVSVSQIIDAKNTYKSVLECEGFRKNFSKNSYGSWWNWYVWKALDSGIPKLVSQSKMGKDLMVFCWSKNHEFVSWIWQWRVLNLCVYAVYILEITRKRPKCSIYMVRRRGGATWLFTKLPSILNTGKQSWRTYGKDKFTLHTRMYEAQTHT